MVSQYSLNGAALMVSSILPLTVCRQQIMAALNAQTAVQFQQYAAQQYPESPEQQLGLIRQLQEQHYQQYMQQLYQVQLAQQQVHPPTMSYVLHTSTHLFQIQGNKQY